VFLEPVMGAGGIVVPPVGYYPAMTEVARRYGVRVIGDEVITGFGRTGELWGCTTVDLVPDSTSCAKAITGGYIPAGAVMVDQAMNEVLLAQSQKFGIFAHGFTTGGHPVAAAVALRTLEVIERRKLVENVRALSPVLEAKLARIAELPQVADLRGVGFLWGLELAGDDGSDRVLRVVEEAAARGLIVRGIEIVICMCVPMVADEEVVEAIGDRLLESVLAVEGQR
jgi:4-aminobutyrate--pyruvate transaminase